MINPDSRLFTFGCSFTKYWWPTWATITAQSFSQFENWGCVGAGNVFIFNAFVEASISRKINVNDTVMIMWSSVPREDRYKDRRWMCPGNIYNQKLYSRDIVDSIADVRGFYIRDLALMHATKMMLEKIGCRYYFMSMIDIANPWETKQENKDAEISDLLQQYEQTLKVFRPSVHEIIFNFDWWSRPYNEKEQTEAVKKSYEAVAGPDWPPFDAIVSDNFTNTKKQVLLEIFDTTRWNWKDQLLNSKRANLHPTPAEHLEYVQKVLPEIHIDQSTINIIEQIDILVRHRGSYEALQSKLKQSLPIARW